MKQTLRSVQTKDLLQHFATVLNRLEHSMTNLSSTVVNIQTTQTHIMSDIKDLKVTSAVIYPQSTFSTRIPGVDRTFSEIE